MERRLKENLDLMEVVDRSLEVMMWGTTTCCVVPTSYIQILTCFATSNIPPLSYSKFIAEAKQEGFSGGGKCDGGSKAELKDHIIKKINNDTTRGLDDGGLEGELEAGKSEGEFEEDVLGNDDVRFSCDSLIFHVHQL